MPLRRYQTPSLVRQTSSASIRAPFVSLITIGPDLPSSLLLVETGLELTAPFSGRGDGEVRGEGDGEASGDGLGSGDERFVSGRGF